MIRDAVMPKYVITLLYDACESIEVEADSPDAALDAAYGRAEASLCYQCSEHLELGDVVKAIVCDADGNEIGHETQP